MSVVILPDPPFDIETMEPEILPPGWENPEEHLAPPEKVLQGTRQKFYKGHVSNHFTIEEKGGVNLYAFVGNKFLQGTCQWSFCS